MRRPGQPSKRPTEETSDQTSLKPPFNPHYIKASPEERTYTHTPLQGLRYQSSPPYSRKPGLFGPNVSVSAKGVSRGIHNIAFLLSPDCFRAFDFKIKALFSSPLHTHHPIKVSPFRTGDLHPYTLQGHRKVTL